VVAAQNAARNHRNFYVSTEHLLLGLLADRDDRPVRALESLDLDVDSVRRQVEQAIKPGQQQPSGPVSLTPRALTVIELAGQEAALAGQDEVDSSHILLGLIREGQGVAAQVLIAGGAGLVPTRRAVQTGSARPWKVAPSPAPPPSPRPAAPARISAAVRASSRDLTQAARNGDLAPAIGRGREIGDLMRVLSQYFAKNPVLVCESPEDRWTVVSGLAHQIAVDQVPDPLRGQRVLAVNVEMLLKQLAAAPLDEVTVPAVVAEIRALGDVIFCVDDLGTLMVDSHSGPPTVLKALLADDGIKLIGETVRRGKGHSGDVSFEQFEPIQVPEPATLYDIAELNLKFEGARYFEV